MSRWQRRARFLIAVFAVVFTVFVAFALKRRGAAVSNPGPITRTDPKAVVESTGGHVFRLNDATDSREDATISYERLLTYTDGSSKLLGVRVVSDDRRTGRQFTLTGKEAEVGQNQTAMTMTGDVRLVASDGLTARTEHATYSDGEGMVRAPGPVAFSRGRLGGHGVGMTYDKNRDVMTIQQQAVVTQAADEKGHGLAEIAAATATIARRDKIIRFDGGVNVRRDGRVTSADMAVAYLDADGKHVENLELRGNSRIAAGEGAAGGLEGLTGRDMNLKYGAEGQKLEHALIVGDAVMQFTGAGGKKGRQIQAGAIEITLAPDGVTPTVLVARDNVRLLLPSEQGNGTRTIRADALDGSGEAGKGLTVARFNGNVDFREQIESGGRAARSKTLDLTLKPGGGAIEDAKFSNTVRFEQERIEASAASARYVPDKGVLELSGSEPATLVPHVVNEQIAIDATRIDVTLAGPKVKATGNVKSVVQPTPAKRGAKPADAKMPSMLKPDQPVNVTAGDLSYDGAVSKATYTGGAQLWQGDTSIRAATIMIEGKAGDLTAGGTVATSVVLEQANPMTKARERVRSVGTAKDLKYEEDLRRATYTGDVHLSGPQGDMTAGKIELYLKGSGANELDRAEASDSVTLRETGRKTTGDRMTYFGADERYLVTGTPVKILDECARETIGRTLTFHKATDTIIVDGKQQIRTQTKGGGKCP